MNDVGVFRDPGKGHMGSSLAGGANIKTGGTTALLAPCFPKKPVHNAVLLPCPPNFRFCTKILSSA